MKATRSSTIHRIVPPRWDCGAAQWHAGPSDAATAASRRTRPSGSTTVKHAG